MQPKPTPIKAHLFLFFLPQEKLPDKKINNLTTDWNDGILVAALVDACGPGLIPEHATLNPQNSLENASHAMKLADDWLGIPQVSSCAAAILVSEQQCSLSVFLNFAIK